MKLYFLSLILLSLNLTNAQNSGIVINEILATNSDNIKDPEFGENSDWIEIYNYGEDEINLNGFFITDDLKKPAKWQYTGDKILMPGEFFIFWADGNDTLNHTNFNISKDGEQIGLFFPDGSAADTISFGTQFKDVSFGRIPDASADWFYMSKPTPGASNDTAIYNNILEEPVFSVSPGFYAGSITLEISSSEPDAVIRYTVDGSLPDSNSSIYTEQLLIDETTVIRAAAFKEDVYSSKPVTGTYFINENIALPVVSISTNPDNLWNDSTGIYVAGTNGITGYCSNQPRNWNQDWEKPVHLEMFEKDKSFGFRLDAGMKIGGGCTRLYDQKPLAIYARGIYGYGKIEYPIFPERDKKKYNNLAIRNMGQDWWRSLIRDGLMQTIIMNKLDVEWQAYKPAVLFLNGEYWGIHELREKHNEHYLAENFNLDPDSIDILSGNASVKEGSNEHYKQLLSYIETHDLSQSAAYEYVKTQMDISNYIDYNIAEIYYANVDWPGGNIKYWRERKPGAKWRWIVFDLDLGFNAHGQGQYDDNTLAYATSETQDYYANPPSATFLLRNLLKNDEFKNDFIQKFAYHMNTTFNAERINYFIDSIKSLIETEVPRHKQKWAKSMSLNFSSWDEQIESLHEFAEKRAFFVRNHISTKFNLTGSSMLRITVNDSAYGKVLLNGIQLSKDFSGLFFNDIPVELIAVPAEGYKFKKWSGLSSSASDSIKIQINSPSQVTAEFEKLEPTAIQNENGSAEFFIAQNYPNPFNPVTTFTYGIKEASLVTIKIFDILGNEIAELVSEQKLPGTYSLNFDGGSMTSGIYFYKIYAQGSTTNFSQTKKLVLLK